MTSEIYEGMTYDLVTNDIMTRNVMMYDAMTYDVMIPGVPQKSPRDFQLFFQKHSAY